MCVFEFSIASPQNLCACVWLINRHTQTRCSLLFNSAIKCTTGCQPYREGGVRDRERTGTCDQCSTWVEINQEELLFFFIRLSNVSIYTFQHASLVVKIAQGGHRKCTSSILFSCLEAFTSSLLSTIMILSSVEKNQICLTCIIHHQHPQSSFINELIK